MKRIDKLILGILLLVLTGCEDPDFSEYSDNGASGEKFRYPNKISLEIGNDGYATINGIDSCFIQLIDGEDIVAVSPRYVVGDRCFYGGITSYLQFHPLAEGVAHCRLYNDRLGFCATLSISIKGNYKFYPEDRDFLLSKGHVQFEVVGPNNVGVDVTDKFIIQQKRRISGGSDGHLTRTSVDIYFKHVGTAYVKFYNEDIDTLIQINVLPTYFTFEEPPLDFDDTRDSVVAKLGVPQKVNAEGQYLQYNCHGPVYDYTIRVNMLSWDEMGEIKDYEVVLADEEATEAVVELHRFVEERYMEVSSWNGYDVYARAVNTTYPSLYDSETKVLVMNYLQAKVIYKNPSKHSNW